MQNNLTNSPFPQTQLKENTLRFEKRATPNGQLATLTSPDSTFAKTLEKEIQKGTSQKPTTSSNAQDVAKPRAIESQQRETKSFAGDTPSTDASGKSKTLKNEVNDEEVSEEKKEVSSAELIFPFAPLMNRPLFPPVTQQSRSPSEQDFLSQETQPQKVNSALETLGLCVTPSFMPAPEVTVLSQKTAVVQSLPFDTSEQSLKMDKNLLSTMSPLSALENLAAASYPGKTKESGALTSEFFPQMSALISNSPKNDFNILSHFEKEDLLSSVFEPQNTPTMMAPFAPPLGPRMLENNPQAVATTGSKFGPGKLNSLLNSEQLLNSTEKLNFTSIETNNDGTQTQYEVTFELGTELAQDTTADNVLKQNKSSNPNEIPVSPVSNDTLAQGKILETRFQVTEAVPAESIKEPQEFKKSDVSSSISLDSKYIKAKSDDQQEPNEQKQNGNSETTAGEKSSSLEEFLSPKPHHEKEKGKFEQSFAGEIIQQKSRPASETLNAGPDKTTADTSPVSQNIVEKAKDASAAIQAKGGGSARIQVSDPKMGNIDLTIKMGTDNKLYIQLKTSNESMKSELEKGLSKLKESIEGQNLKLGEISVSTDMAFSNKDSRDFQRQQDQSQQERQERQNTSRQSSGDSSNFSQHPGHSHDGHSQRDKNSFASNAGTKRELGQFFTEKPSVRQSFVQRGANGSLKVNA